MSEIPAHSNDESRQRFVDAIATAIRAEMSNLTIPEDTHKEHHEFIRQWIDKQKRKDERWDKIKAQVGGWAIVTLLGSIGTGAYHGAIYIRDHLK